jgi:dipeptidyl aminopeptidase/acylaminoacyl peptidase
MRLVVIRPILASLVFGPVVAVAQAPPPVEAFASLPAMESPSLSPDGKRLAFIAKAATGSFVLVSNLETMAVTSAVDMSAGKPRAVTWTSDDTLLLFSGDTVSFGPRGNVESLAPYGINLAREASVRQLLVSRARVGVAQVGGFQFIQGAQFIGHKRSTGEVLFPRFAENADRVLYAVDPKTDQRIEIDHGTPQTRDWIVDENGAPKFRLEYNQQTDFLRILARRADSWEPIREETVEIPELDLYGLDGAGELIVGLRPKETGRYGLYVMSAADGSLARSFYLDDTADVAGVQTDPYTNRVIAAGVAGEPPVYFDKELAAQQRLVEEAFPGESPRLVSWSQDRARFILAADRRDKAPAFYLYDARAASAEQIASTYVGLDRTKLPPREAYSYKARDGVEIPGYLTRPLDAPGAVPLVVLPHGGPAARDVGGFDWLAHFLASRGYAVLQPNFRGSDGFGKAWEEAGHGQWGVGVMQHDVTDGVAALVSAGIADAERICIVGASYGGYAALAGAAFTPELYRCAAAIAGVSDLRAMLQSTRNRMGGFSATLSYWRLAMGVDEGRESAERLRAASPIEHVANVRAPVLLIHGLDDTVVPIVQSRDMATALQDAGKTVELVELEGEDHWLSGAKTRLATLQALDAFLAKHLKE